MPRQVLLGQLRARRNGLAFEPIATGDVLATPGEELEIAVAYDYDEPTLAQDHFEASLRVDAPAAGGPVATVVGDQPFARDRAAGVLVRRIVVQGPAEVPFEVRATLGHRPWTVRPGSRHGGVQLVEHGVVRVRVS